MVRIYSDRGGDLRYLPQPCSPWGSCKKQTLTQLDWGLSTCMSHKLQGEAILLVCPLHSEWQGMGNPKSKGEGYLVQSTQAQKRSQPAAPVRTATCSAGWLSESHIYCAPPL